MSAGLLGLNHRAGVLWTRQNVFGRRNILTAMVFAKDEEPFSK
jgi:hypothetical protein